MTSQTTTLIAELMNMGVRLRIVGDALRYNAPKGVMTPELVDALRAAKTEILAAVSPRTRAVACMGCGWVYFAEPSLCYWCRQKSHHQPVGEPCPGCGEACEGCLGADPDSNL